MALIPTIISSVFEFPNVTVTIVRQFSIGAKAARAGLVFFVILDNTVYL
jgi:hypothetical protein